MKRCEGNNDKVKYCVLMCGDDNDGEIIKAAAGALAMLTEVVDNGLFITIVPFFFSLDLQLWGL